MKLADIPLGSETTYLEAFEIVTDQLIAEIETCKDILGTDPEVLLALIASIDTTEFAVLVMNSPGVAGRKIVNKK